MGSPSPRSRSNSRSMSRGQQQQQRESEPWFADAAGGGGRVQRRPIGPAAHDTAGQQDADYPAARAQSRSLGRTGELDSARSPLGSSTRGRSGLSATATTGAGDRGSYNARTHRHNHRSSPLPSPERDSGAAPEGSDRPQRRFSGVGGSGSGSNARSPHAALQDRSPTRLGPSGAAAAASRGHSASTSQGGRSGSASREREFLRRGHGKLAAASSHASAASAASGTALHHTGHSHSHARNDQTPPWKQASGAGGGAWERAAEPEVYVPAPGGRRLYQHVPEDRPAQDRQWDHAQDRVHERMQDRHWEGTARGEADMTPLAPEQYEEDFAGAEDDEGAEAVQGEDRSGRDSGYDRYRDSYERNRDAPLSDTFNFDHEEDDEGADRSRPAASPAASSTGGARADRRADALCFVPYTDASGEQRGEHKHRTGGPAAEGGARTTGGSSSGSRGASGGMRPSRRYASAASASPPSAATATAQRSDPAADHINTRPQYQEQQQQQPQMARHQPYQEQQPQHQAVVGARSSQHSVASRGSDVGLEHIRPSSALPASGSATSGAAESNATNSVVLNINSAAPVVIYAGGTPSGAASSASVHGEPQGSIHEALSTASLALAGAPSAPGHAMAGGSSASGPDPGQLGSRSGSVSVPPSSVMLLSSSASAQGPRSRPSSLRMSAARDQYSDGGRAEGDRDDGGASPHSAGLELSGIPSQARRRASSQGPGEDAQVEPPAGVPFSESSYQKQRQKQQPQMHTRQQDQLQHQHQQRQYERPVSRQHTGDSDAEPHQTPAAMHSSYHHHKQQSQAPQRLAHDQVDSQAYLQSYSSAASQAMDDGPYPHEGTASGLATSSYPVDAESNLAFTPSQNPIHVSATVAGPVDSISGTVPGPRSVAATFIPRCLSPPRPFDEAAGPGFLGSTATSRARSKDRHMPPLLTTIGATSPESTARSRPMSAPARSPSPPPNQTENTLRSQFAETRESQSLDGRRPSTANRREEQPPSPRVLRKNHTDPASESTKQRTAEQPHPYGAPNDYSGFVEEEPSRRSSHADPVLHRNPTAVGPFAAGIGARPPRQTHPHQNPHDFHGHQHQSIATTQLGPSRPASVSAPASFLQPPHASHQYVGHAIPPASAPSSQTRSVVAPPAAPAAVPASLNDSYRSTSSLQSLLLPSHLRDLTTRLPPGPARDIALGALIQTREEQLKRLIGSADEQIVQLAAAAVGAATAAEEANMELSAATTRMLGAADSGMHGNTSYLQQPSSGLHYPPAETVPRSFDSDPQARPRRSPEGSLSAPPSPSSRSRAAEGRGSDGGNPNTVQDVMPSQRAAFAAHRQSPTNGRRRPPSGLKHTLLDATQRSVSRRSRGNTDDENGTTRTVPLVPPVLVSVPEPKKSRAAMLLQETAEESDLFARSRTQTSGIPGYPNFVNTGGAGILPRAFGATGGGLAAVVAAQDKAARVSVLLSGLTPNMWASETYGAGVGTSLSSSGRAIMGMGSGPGGGGRGMGLGEGINLAQGPWPTAMETGLMPPRPASAGDTHGQSYRGRPAIAFEIDPFTPGNALPKHVTIPGTQRSSSAGQGVDALDNAWNAFNSLPSGQQSGTARTGGGWPTNGNGFHSTFAFPPASTPLLTPLAHMTASSGVNGASYAGGGPMPPTMLAASLGL
jgi:hypothetical protein